MKLQLLAPLAWLGAIALATVLVVRARRGRVAVLGGRWSPRFVRMVAIAIVMFAGLAPREAPAQEDPRTDDAGGDDRGPATEPLVPLAGELPAEFRTRYQRWAEICRSHRSIWTSAKRGLESLESGVEAGDREILADLRLAVGPAGRSYLESEFQRLRGREVEPPAAAGLVEALDDFEAAGIYDGWIAGRLWRSSRHAARRESTADGARDLATLYGRLVGHLRVVHTIVQVEGITGPVSFHPWMSKAAAPRDHQDLNVPAERFVTIAARFYPLVGLETWATEATLRLRVLEGGGQLHIHRYGRETIVPENSVFDFGRLDLLRAVGDAVVVEHAALGRIEIPAGETFSAHGAPEFLGPDAGARIEVWVEAAAGGDRSALVRLERTLPASHAAIRRALAADGKQPGAPALRMALAIFDE